MPSGTKITPKLSTFDASMIVVSLVIGIGIFRTPAIVASHAGSPALFYGAWILGGVISLFGALTFAEIGSRFPKPGAFYQVVAESYHPAVAFMLNWTSVTIVNGAGGAAVAVIGAEYLTPVLFPPEHRTLLATQVTAAGLAAFLIGINALGIKTGAWTQNILTILKVGMIGVLALAGLAAGATSSVVSSPALTLPSSPLPALGLALIPVFYTYGGYQSAINLGGDIANPARNLPRSIFVGIAIVLSAYLFINVAFERSLGIEGVAAAPLVAAEVARAAFGPAGQKLISVAIFLSALGFLNVTLMHIPRAYYAMAADGALPARFMKVDSGTQAQRFTLLFFGALNILSIFFLGTFEKLMNYVMLFDAFNNAVVASTIFVLRYRNITAGVQPYTVPFYPALPALFIVILLTVSVNVILSQPGSVVVGFAFVAAGFPLYLIMRRLSQKRAPR
jgi:APA family basic amino acid/polyamine antiporter